MALEEQGAGGVHPGAVPAASHGVRIGVPTHVQFTILGVFALPFTKALTLNVGFPLKISEVMFAAALALFVWTRQRVPARVFTGYVVFLLLFWLSATGSSLYAVLGTPPAVNVSYRGGAVGDGLMRIAYLAFNMLVFILLFCVAARHRRLIVRAWLMGMAVAVLYHMYCFLSVQLTGDAIMLPGLERHQMGFAGPFLVPRSGTFEEGNFAGLFYIVSAAIALYARKYLFLALAVGGVGLSLSTTSYLGLLLFAGAYVVARNRSFVKNVAFVGVSVAVAIGAFYGLAIGTKFEDSAGASGAVRLNETMTGIEIFQAHPLFGAGLGQYGFLFDAYEWNPALSQFANADKHIANNVYVELLAETGLVGFALFALFWLRWAQLLYNGRKPASVFFFAALAIAVAWFAYPTFNMTYLWCFAGLAMSTFYSGPSTTKAGVTP